MNYLILFTTSMCVLSFYIIQMALLGPMKSISITDKEHLKYPWKWVFEAVMFYIGGTLAFIGYQEGLILFTISGIGVILVGVFGLGARWRRFLNSNLYQWSHNISALIGFGAMAVSVVYLSVWLLAVPALVLGLTVMFSSKSTLILNIELNLIYSLTPIITLIVYWL